MGKRIFFHPNRCLLCLSCVLACQMESLGISDVTEIPYNGKPRQRLAMTFTKGTPWVWKCQHCASAPCVEACISGSLRYGEKGMVIHEPETCVGCGSCVLVCPYGALFFDDDEERVAKCDLCPQEATPPCVHACQSGALVYQEPSVFAHEKKKRFVKEQKRAW